MIEPYSVMMRIVGSPSMTIMGANATRRFLKTLDPLPFCTAGLVFRTVSGRKKATKTKTTQPMYKSIYRLVCALNYTQDPHKRTEYCCKVKSRLPSKELAQKTTNKCAQGGTKKWSLVDSVN